MFVAHECANSAAFDFFHCLPTSTRWPCSVIKIVQSIHRCFIPAMGFSALATVCDPCRCNMCSMSFLTNICIHLSNKGDETCVSMRHVQEHMGCRMPQRLGHEADGFVRKPAAVRSLLIFIDSFHTSWPPSWPHLERRLEVFACFFVRSCLGWHFVAFISSSDCIQVWVWLSIDSSWGVQGQESQHWLLLSFLRQLQGKRHRPHKAAGGCWRHGCVLLLSCKQLFVKILDFLCARQVVIYLKP